MTLTLEGGPANGRRAAAPVETDELIPFYFYIVHGGRTRHYCSLYDINGVYMETVEAARANEGEVLIEGHFESA
jgi:hypothetical protein